jgi:hypothetical protein
MAFPESGVDRLLLEHTSTENTTSLMNPPSLMPIRKSHDELQILPRGFISTELRSRIFSNIRSNSAPIVRPNSGGSVICVGDQTPRAPTMGGDLSLVENHPGTEFVRRLMFNSPSWITTPLEMVVASLHVNRQTSTNKVRIQRIQEGERAGAG